MPAPKSALRTIVLFLPQEARMLRLGFPCTVAGFLAEATRDLLLELRRIRNARLLFESFYLKVNRRAGYFSFSVIKPILSTPAFRH